MLFWHIMHILFFCILSSKTLTHNPDFAGMKNSTIKPNLLTILTSTDCIQTKRSTENKCVYSRANSACKISSSLTFINRVHLPPCNERVVQGVLVANRYCSSTAQSLLSRCQQCWMAALLSGIPYLPVCTVGVDEVLIYLYITLRWIDANSR